MRMRLGSNLSRWQGELARPALASYTNDDLQRLPEPVRRHLRYAIAPGSPLFSAAVLTMRGSIKIGRWRRFRARQVLNPHSGFIWKGRTGVIRGYDRYLDGDGSMTWRLAGLVPVARGRGADVSRSAAGRCAAEAVWLPTALLPRFGATWSAKDDNHISVKFRLDTTDVEVHYELDGDGGIRSFVFDRWGDPNNTGSFGWHPFGGEITGYHTFGSLTVPSSGRLGWGFGTDGWKDGEFFRFDIATLTPLVNFPSAGVRAPVGHVVQAVLRSLAPAPRALDARPAVAVEPQRPGGAIHPSR